MSVQRTCIVVLLGATGVLLAIISGSAALGSSPFVLFHFPEMAIVVGVTFFGLLATHRDQLVQFWLAARSNPRTTATEALVQRVANAGRIYAVIGGMVALVPGGLAVTGQLDVDPESLSLWAAGMLTGVAWALFLSEVVIHGFAVLYSRRPDFSHLDQAIRESTSAARQVETP